METLTINNTNTIQTLKAMGAKISNRENNHQVRFAIAGRLYEIAAKNNRDYQLNLLSYTNENFKRELSFDANPLNLINRDWNAQIAR
jgi:hypothetical protein